MKIYVANLSFGTEAEHLKQIFTPYGEVSSVNVIMDRVTNRSRGFAFVEMPDKTAAENAIRELNGSQLDGRAIKANEANERENRPSRPSYN